MHFTFERMLTVHSEVCKEKDDMEADQWYQTNMKEKAKNKAQLAKFRNKIDG
jgi:hypothetical protein